MRAKMNTRDGVLLSRCYNCDSLFDPDVTFITGLRSICNRSQMCCNDIHAVADFFFRWVIVPRGKPLSKRYSALFIIGDQGLFCPPRSCVRHEMKYRLCDIDRDEMNRRKCDFAARTCVGATRMCAFRPFFVSSIRKKIARHMKRRGVAKRHSILLQT